LSVRWFSIAALLLSLACGSRSALLDSTGSDGGGLGGTSGGSNGGSTACSTFAVATPTLEVPNLGEEDLAPAFVDPSNDTGNVTLVFVRRPSAPGQPTLTHVAFPAWDAWPPQPELGPGFASLTAPTLKNEHRVAPSLQGKFAAAAVLSGVVRFAPQVSVNPPVTTGNTLPLLGTKPLFLSELDDQAFVIGTLSIQRELYVQIADPTLQDPVPIATIGCADDELVGGAVPFANGWLLAHSNGANAPAAVCEPPATANAGSATRIDIVKLEKSSITNLLTSIDASNRVRELVVAAHPDGISFAWIDGALHWARYVGKTGALVGPVVVSEATDSPSGLAMTAFGARSLVTYTRSSGKAALVTKLLDASGSEWASVALAMELVGRAAIIADPAEHAALLAYESMSPGVIEVTRLECSP
jgi:hypothetical protein